MKKEEMQKINIDGKIYYLEEDVEKYAEKQTNKKTLEDVILMIDKYCVIGMGSSTVNDDFVAVKIDMGLFEKAIKSIRAFDPKRDNITIAWTKEHPLMIGDVKKNKFAGIIIAPKGEGE